MSEGFTPTRLEEDREKDKRENFTIRMNKEERFQLDEDKKVLEQSKDSTAIKQMWQIGRIVLHDDLTGKISKEIMSNKRRNKRLGIVDFE